MSDIEKNIDEEVEEVPVLTLTDEDGLEQDFELLAKAELDGNVYFALVPVTDGEPEEYVILRAEGDDEDLSLETIEDDEEFDKVADYFNDLFFEEEN